MTIARSSLSELLDSLDEALIKRYINAAEHKELDLLVRSARFSANALRKYLHSAPTPKERRRRKSDEA